MSVAGGMLPAQAYGGSISSYHSFVWVMPVLVNIGDVER